MQITLKSDWESWDAPLRFDRELRIAGLFASIEFRGDVYEWRVREDDQWAADIACGWVDSFGDAEVAAEAVIRDHLLKEG